MNCRRGGAGRANKCQHVIAFLAQSCEGFVWTGTSLVRAVGMSEPALKKAKVCKNLLSLFEAQKDVPAVPEAFFPDPEQEAEKPEPPAEAEGEPEPAAEPKAKAKAKATAKAKAEAKAKAKAEAKAKAKAEAEAKAKAKAEAKAKAKAAKETKSKKKGTSGESAKTDREGQGSESGEKPESSEKPEDPGQSKVSAAEKLRQRAGALVADLQESEPAAAAAGTEELRDKRKTRHFEKHLHELPASVQELWKNKSVARADKTKLVNSSVVQGDKGWELVQQNPLFEAMAKTYSSVCGKSKEKTYPRAIMVGKCGGEANFTKGLQEGDIVAVEEDGKTFFKYCTMEIQRKSGVETAQHFKQQAESTDEAEKQFQAYVDGFQPEFLEVTSCPASFQPVQPPKTLAICDGLLETDSTVPVPVDGKQLAKIDDALSWINQAKTATFKFQHLKGQLDQKWEGLLPLQLQLEQIKLTGKVAHTSFKSLMVNVGSSLLEVQELLKSISVLS